MYICTHLILVLVGNRIINIVRVNVHVAVAVRVIECYSYYFLTSFFCTVATIPVNNLKSSKLILPTK